MNKRFQGFFAGMLTMLLLMGAAAMGKSMYEKIDVLYNDIKIVIDGEEFVPTDVNGNVVEPFIYNGTTYLPVRAIATAFDKDVGWDEATYTVSLNTKIENAGETGPEINAPEIPDDNVDINGKWEYDMKYVFASLGVSDEVLADRRIVLVYEFNADGTYKSYLPEECLDDLVDGAFENALHTYGLTEAEYVQASGLTAEETKQQIAEQLSLSANNFYEEGIYSLKGGVFYSIADGKEQTPAAYTLEGDILTLDNGELVLTLVKIK